MEQQQVQEQEQQQVQVQEQEQVHVQEQQQVNKKWAIFFKFRDNNKIFNGPFNFVSKEKVDSMCPQWQRV